MRDVRRLKKLPHVVAVAPVVSTPRIKASYRTNQWISGLFGVDQSYWKTQTPHLLAGRLISASDVVARKRVAVVGKDVVKYLFKGEKPVGKVVRVGNTDFTVIGQLGGIQHTDIRAAIFVPITTAQSLFKGLDKIGVLYARVDDWNSVSDVHSSMMATLKMAHRGYEEGIRLLYFPDRVQRVQTMVSIVKLFIYASLVVTFILGKVGLTNVMLAAIQDRTREIGLRKALGARERTIRFQFLSESVLISLMAGIAGVIVGLVAVQILRGKLGVEVSSYVMSISVLMDLAFTVSIGVVAGMYPSAQASRLDVVTAMRFE
jgi:putative ABC transport system permease protein